MSKKIHIIEIETTDPYYQKAIEAWVIKTFMPSEQVLLLYQMRNTVSLGMHQNARLSTKVEKLKKDGVNLVRRRTGGGSVYHDLGATEFLFLAPKAIFDIDLKYQVLIKALRSLGLEVDRQNHNFMIDERRIGGGAFKQMLLRCYFQGSILIHSNLSELQYYPQPSPKLVRSRRVKPITRPLIANIQDFLPNVTHEQVCYAIISAYCAHYENDVDVLFIDEAKLKAIPQIHQQYKQIQADAWECPEPPNTKYHFEAQLSWGLIDLYFDVSEEKMHNVIIFSDALEAEIITALHTALSDLPYQADVCQSELNKLVKQNPAWESQIGEFLDWLLTEI